MKHVRKTYLKGKNLMMNSAKFIYFHILSCWSLLLLKSFSNCYSIKDNKQKIIKNGKKFKFKGNNFNKESSNRFAVNEKKVDLNFPIRFCTALEVFQITALTAILVCRQDNLSYVLPNDDCDQVWYQFGWLFQRRRFVYKLTDDEDSSN